MRHMICFALLGLLVSSGAAFPQARLLARPRGRVVFVGPRFIRHPRIFHRYEFLAPLPYPVWNFIEPFPSYVLSAPESPTYVFVGSDSPSHPQLVFKDGTIYTVSDYWRENDQLHFITVEEGGTKSVPHSVLFDTLDLQRTKDAAEAQGFHFVIRDEPIQQYLEHHAQHAPGAAPEPLGKADKLKG